ncbi:hypothetical protein [Pseudonocardia parietis]|uniref:Uncharacterized protein n=1 Tax=Pseudonocardia parietis TaxID=570936 RepID=A0ABS4W5R7_9PSEU|nr:hypothetical protein [Pseudonocardia parietis]MBP2371551.1 hypothetical protein [Pseudonocardia parietis]
MTARDPLLTISGSPGIYHDPSRPEHGSIATLTLVPPVGVFTADDRPGAEQPVDVVVSAVLGHGFALVSALGVAELAALPAPAGGTARLDALTGTLRLDVGVLGYVGDVGVGTASRLGGCGEAAGTAGGAGGHWCQSRLPDSRSGLRDPRMRQES